MAEKVTKIRIWTIADFKEEEIWLREMARRGLHFLRMYVPCFYVFEKGEPRDVIYRLDFTSHAEDADYQTMLGEFGWENCGRCMGWIYWRRNADELADEREGELFSDDESRLALVKKVIFTRMLPWFVNVIVRACCAGFSSGFTFAETAAGLEGRSVRAITW